jgi:catechol 2,3-dioxygenase
VAFYEGVLGLHEVGASADRSFVALSWGDNVHDVALMRGSPTPGGSVHHVAITLQGGPAELRAFAAELAARGVTVEMALDHLVSQSLYVRDPDGNLIEVFVDMPRESWAHIPGAVTYGAPLVL